MANKKILGLAIHTHPGAIARKEDVGTARAQNTVAVRMHLEQVLTAMQARNLMLVSDFVIIRIRRHIFAAVVEDLNNLGRFEPVLGVKVQARGSAKREKPKPKPQ